ncbi:MAG: VTT domain-containing protein, partial [Alphaproteobacteria bacterium]
RFFSLETLQAHHGALRGWVQAHTVLAVAAAIVAYALATAFSLPIGVFLTVTLGFAFGTWWISLAIVSGATIGATALFLAARSGLGEPLRARAGPGVRRMEAGFRANAFSYLLTLRLIPLFPFWLVNLVPAFLGVSVRTYVIATFVGIIPGTVVYTQFGVGLASVIAQGDELTATGVLTPEVAAALGGLALIALAPVAYRWFRRRRAAV